MGASISLVCALAIGGLAVGAYQAAGSFAGFCLAAAMVFVAAGIGIRWALAAERNIDEGAEEEAAHLP